MLKNGVIYASKITGQGKQGPRGPKGQEGSGGDRGHRGEQGPQGETGGLQANNVNSVSLRIPTSDVSGTLSLDSIQAGRVLFVRAPSTLTLPLASSNAKTSYTITRAEAGGGSIVIRTSGNDVLTYSSLVNGPSLVRQTASSVTSISAGSVAGDSITLTSDGTASWVASSLAIGFA